eukprot:TRINITY_DN1209_c0_g1_i2.p1 TRINITY_DN1209_c0_g1~~TRINITY_DN1209_c0_g1_i2.p1  ORF type:complete len:125 (+),score=33.25 TRINITY_DN1209_c0_g1_i2:148-522(+)
MAIDTTKLRALNLQDKKSVGDVFKPYDDRFDGKFIESDEDVDEEIILFIPFVCDVQIKSICILGGEDDKSPSTMKVWTNREDIDFSNADNIKCTQKVREGGSGRGGGERRESVFVDMVVLIFLV